MAKMFEGLVKLYTGEKAFSRQITLFSVCGIVGLFNAFVSMEAWSDVTFVQKILFMLLWVVFIFFLIGYEVLFLHERHIPEIDMRSIKLVFNKTLAILFLVSLPFGIVPIFFPAYSSAAFWLETCLAVPMTMLQCGFSYNFRDDEAGMLFPKFGVKDYFILILKRLFILLLAYILTYSLIFLIFFLAGFVIAMIYQGDLTSIQMLITSQQTAVTKLTIFMIGIILLYFLTIGTMVWDYNVLTTYEREEL